VSQRYFETIRRGSRYACGRDTVSGSPASIVILTNEGLVVVLGGTEKACEYRRVKRALGDQRLTQLEVYDQKTSSTLGCSSLLMAKTHVFVDKTKTNKCTTTIIC
jgi:hypothetical protein